MRRSRRTPVPTQQARQHNNDLSIANCPFPQQCDEICVKWVLHGNVVWWGATVVSFLESVGDEQSRVAEILYHKLDNYDREKSLVRFTVDPSTNERLLHAVDDNGKKVSNNDESSLWIFSNEEIPLDHPPSPSHSSSAISNGASEHSSLTTDQNNQFLSAPHPRMKSLPVAKTISRFESRRRRSSSRRTSAAMPSSTDYQQASSDETPRTTAHQNIGFQSKSRDGLRSARKQRITGTSLQPRRTSAELNVTFNGSTARRDSYIVPTQTQMQLPTMLTQSEPTSEEVHSVVNRLSLRMILFERQLSQFPTDSSSPSMTPSSLVLLLGLKWSLMKRMERPLKDAPNQGDSKKGVSTGVISVKCDCDHNTFRDIASHISCISNNEPNDSSRAQRSRTNFVPNLNRALSTSLGSDNIFITFTTLSDLTDLLGINDEDDFEQILCKEYKGSEKHLVQVVGSLAIVDENKSTELSSVEDDNQSSLSTKSNASVQTTSCATPPFLRIFVGAAPYEIIAQKILPHDVETTSKDKLPCGENSRRTYSSVLFEQPLQNFSMDRNCYRAKWRARLVTTSFLPATKGPADEPDKHNSFFLKWTRMKTPSLTKWTRDSQTLSTTVPGHLQLSLPIVFCSSQSNAISISNLLDKHVETFMDQRIDILKSNQRRVDGS